MRLDLDQTLAVIHGNRLLHLFTWGVRVLLAVGFIPSGLTKLFGVPFTRLDPTTSPVGYFFDALHQAGFLYNFIGFCQVVAAILLLVPRFTTLGALIYLPIIVGIEIITISMDFRGTWIITSLMLLGVIYLLCWDWHKLRYIVMNPPARR